MREPSLLRTMVVDDEPLARERIAGLVRETPELTLVAEGRNGLEALDLITTHEPELVFIDVEMPELSGFGVIAALTDAPMPGVVFVTAYERYALQAFDVGAIDYLHKPVTRERFAAAVRRARERLSPRATRCAEAGTTGTRAAGAGAAEALVAGAVAAERERGRRTRFVVRRGNAHHFVAVSDVEWIDVADNYLRLHVGGRAHFWRGTMKDAEVELDPERFVRVHRSAMVAIDRIVSIASHESGGYQLELRGGVIVKASRPYADRLRTLLR